jgi:hypothetical protein
MAPAGSGHPARHAPRHRQGGRAMALTFRSLLMLVAVIIFLIDAFTNVEGVSLLALGLAAMAAAFVVPDTIVSSRR